MHTKIDTIVNAIDRAMTEEFDGIEFGCFDIETNTITVQSRPVTRDGYKTIIVNAGALSTVVTYNVRARTTLYVNARKDVVKALTDECKTYGTFEVVRV